MGELIKVENLVKTFRIGFWMRKVEAVKGVSFDVQSGDIFGFLGPNGAGKTTTIKILTGLIAPTAGKAEVFGVQVPNPRGRRQLGFLPENPYVYPFLTPREFVEMSGRLSGLSRAAARDRTKVVLEKVGIAYAAERPVRRLSKGMLQRTGIAAALVADPELLILDEPMSGLDPVGRMEVRDLILAERAAGRTIFFSTHILTDVETLCDRVCILRKGEVVVRGKLAELLRDDVQRTDVTLVGASDEVEKRWASEGLEVQRIRDRLVVRVEGASKLPELLRSALDSGAQVAEVVPKHETLEDLFVREAIEQKRLNELEAQAGP